MQNLIQDSEIEGKTFRYSMFSYQFVWILERQLYVNLYIYALKDSGGILCSVFDSISLRRALVAEWLKLLTSDQMA